MASKSLEALKRLKADLIRVQCELFDDNCNDERVLAVYQLEDYQTIKQDLEQKEELEKENQDFRYIFQAIKALGELRLEKQVNGEFTYYAIVIGDFCILIEEEQYELLKEVIKNGRDNKISD